MRPCGRSDEASRYGVGDPTGPEPLLRPVRAWAVPAPDPRSRLQVPRSFDAVFTADRIRVVLTPFRAPQANAFAERWVRTVRRECLDWTLVFGRRHLQRVLREYVVHYNARRPHRGLDLRAPDAPSDPPTPASTSRGMRRHDILGGLIHEYELAA